MKGEYCRSNITTSICWLKTPLLATIYDGGSRSDAARIGDVGLRIIRDWVLRFDEAAPDGLIA